MVNQAESGVYRRPAAVTNGIFSVRVADATIMSMSTGTGAAKYRCSQCEMPENQCECEKYCCLCQSVIDIRLCADGLLYCEPCRTACDYKTSSD